MCVCVCVCDVRVIDCDSNRSTLSPRSQMNLMLPIEEVVYASLCSVVVVVDSGVGVDIFCVWLR